MTSSHHDWRTALRFGIAGAVNTLFGWAVYSISILFGAAPWMALIIGTIIGISFNFISIGGYAFRDLTARRLPRFVACYVALYLLNLGCLLLLQKAIPDPMWAQATLTPPMAITSYLMLSRLVFRNRLSRSGDKIRS